MRVAALDLGTNTCLLLVAEQHGASVSALLERATVTRLGAGVDRTRALAPDAVQRTLACLAAYADSLRELRPERVAAVGTSALRDAAGAEDFLRRAEDLLGVRPQVISGAEEARLAFRGSLAGLTVPDAVTVFDVGGGSTELVHRPAGAPEPLPAVSLDVGSVRLTERHVTGDPPTRAELARVRAEVRAALDTVPAPREGALVGVAGTVTSLAAVSLGLAPYDGARVHGHTLSRAAVSEVLGRLASLPLSLRREVPGLAPERADVIVAGATLVEEILAWAGMPELVVSDRGVRWGLALDLLER